MSGHESHLQDFKLVSYKRTKKSLQHNFSKNCCTPGVQSENHTNKAALVRRIQEAKLEIGTSDLFASAAASLREGIVILSNPAIKEIVCFGLGRIEVYDVKVRIYDPVFTEIDCWLLKCFNCEVLNENLEGKYKVEDKHTTLFYMPHCPKQLTNNLLWANWGLNLNYCIIVANSFTSIVENTPKRVLNKSGGYIVNITPHVLELAVVNSFKLYEVFNDTAIHIFPWDEIKLLSEDFWAFNSEPLYSDDDVEFIRLKPRAELANS